jgi:hypothetical protein
MGWSIPLRQWSNLSFGTEDDVADGADPAPSVLVVVELEVVDAAVAIAVGAPTSTVVNLPLMVVSASAAVGVVETLVVVVVVSLSRSKGLAWASAHKAIRQQSERIMVVQPRALSSVVERREAAKERSGKRKEWHTCKLSGWSCQGIDICHSCQRG